MNESSNFINSLENSKNDTTRLLKVSKYGENGEMMVLEFDHSLYIPFLLFIFTLPIIVITILCILRQRNRQLVSREIEKINNRRFSTTSGLYNGTVQSLRNNINNRYRSTNDKQKVSNFIDDDNSFIDTTNKINSQINDINKSNKIIKFKGAIDI
ncbi:Hypothetical protein SRAE_1000253500 [Strongyloides ratti]|uniref:Uncharacterized protein n=1 Tax=Strongyloides ratti TaxID=34506 RepID=A0A090L9W5_STRRB|nr:Hypothetical protein SRAE_1000253500 [Strongyloides ratti]CEF64280.1 Hypothetical protein SRAE_1000253500 [Strongyloides ratti]